MPRIYTAKITSGAQLANPAYMTFAFDDTEAAAFRPESRITALLWLLRTTPQPGLSNTRIMGDSRIEEITVRNAAPGSPTSVRPILTVDVNAVLDAWEAIDGDVVAPIRTANYIGAFHGDPNILPMGSAIHVREQAENNIKGRCYVPFASLYTCNWLSGGVAAQTANYVKRMFDLFHSLPETATFPVGAESGVYSRKNATFNKAIAVSVSSTMAQLASRRF